MYDDRPSTKRIVLTLAGWGVGLLVLFGLIFAIANALAPKEQPPAPATTAEPSASVVVTPAQPAAVPGTVTPAPSAPSAPATAAPSVTPTSINRSQPKSSGSLAGNVVVIDAGHQAHGDSSLEPIGPGSSQKKPKVATGASGVSTHNPESLINLDVALKLRQELERRGARVIMVRTTQNVNVSNSRRAQIANNAHAALFIRLHCDGSTNHSQHGLSTLVPNSNSWTAPIVAESRRAASFVHPAVIAATGAQDRGVVDRGDLSGFNWAKVPTVLVEMGFLSNPAEDRKLATAAYQEKLATGLANGIENYLKSK